jgi:NTP pyrophosphatase (non-canonical NTP hydrolase)
MELSRLQRELEVWVSHNFGSPPPGQRLLVITEEVGELAHAQLKQEQGIRMDEDHEANAKDAVADIVIAVASYCNGRGFNLGELVEETWTKVKARDWKADPVGGVHVPPR